jgi:large subunit ribosomal protein L19
MNQLDQELVHHARKTYNRPQWDEVKPGDAVEILYKETGASPRSQMASGILIATKRLGGWNATAKVMAVLGPHPIEYHFPLYSPLVSHIRKVQDRFIHKGTKRVKRAKLYYMRQRPMGELRTPPSQFTKEEREKALIVARRVSAEAKMGKKEKAERDAKKAK